MDKSVFEFDSYKPVMVAYLKKRRGALSRAAEAMNCQRSYLSRVMNSKMHLTPDQAFILGQHLQLLDDEKKYFQLLVEYDRAADRNYRQFVAAEIKSLKQKHESLSEIIKKPQTIEASEAVYFSAWYWTALHFLTSSPEFQTPKDLAKKLELPITFVHSCLDQLNSWGFVKHQNGRYEFAKGEFHLPKGSPFVHMHHQNWRARAILDSQLPTNENIHFTNFQVASRGDIEKIKSLALEFIRNCNQRLGPSKSEDGVAITLDIFKI